MVARFFALSDDVGTFSSFLRRKPVKLTHSGALTDHQHYETFDYEPTMLNNFDDIRFTTQSGEHIPYWIETKTDGVSAKVWFMNDYVDGDTYIWMYYGSEGLSAGSSGNDTFIQYMGAVSTTTLGALEISAPYIYESTGKRVSTVHNVLFGISDTSDLTDESTVIQSYDNNATRRLISMHNGSLSYIEESPVLPADTYVHMKIVNTNAAVTGFVDDDQITTGSITTNLPDEPMGLIFYLPEGTGSQLWAFARKYTATEPTVTVGAEQHPKTGDILIA